MAGSGGGDFLYKVGIDTTQATQALREFTSKTAPSILSEIPALNLKVGYSAAQTNIQNFVAKARAQLSDFPAINVKVSFAGASRSLNAFMNTFGKQAANLEAFQSRMDGLNRSAAQAQGTFGGLANSFRSVNENLGGVSRATTAVVAGNERVAQSTTKTGNALDYLGKMANYTMFKFVEWQVMIQGINAVWNGFTNSLKEGGEVQLEKILQNLYSLTGATIDANQALANATVIAKEWGGNIVDIQQAIGLWTKQTHDLNAATLLANEGEKLARASGVSTLEVYRDSIAIGAQMGITYKQLPAVYDQITRAALHLAEPLRAVNERAGEGQEAIKDLINGLAEASATLGANGFTGQLNGTAAIIAMVSNQITAMGESGKNAARNLSTMFGALSQGGKKRAEYEKILGVDAFSSVDKLLESMKTHMRELQQAQADGLLGVRPAQQETLQTMLKTLDNIDATYKDLKANSRGMLDIVATAELESYQAQVQKLQASLQAFQIELGTRVLPTAQAWVTWMAGYGIPETQKMIPLLIDLGEKAIWLGGSFLLLQGALKGFQLAQQLGVYFMSFSNGLRASAAAEKLATAAGYENAEQMRALQAQLTQLDLAKARDAEETGLLAQAWRELGTAAGLTEAQLARLSEAELAAGAAAQELRTAIQNDTLVLTEEGTYLNTASAELRTYSAAEVDAADKALLLRTNAAAAAEATGGGAAIGMWTAARAGILGVAGAAAAAIAPLAAMLAAMQTAVGFADSFDAEKRGLADFDQNALGHEGIGARLSQVPGGILSGAFFRQGGTSLGELLQGKWQQALGIGGGPTVVPQDLNTAMSAKGYSGRGQYLSDLSAFYAPGGNTPEHAAAIKADIQAYFDHKNALGQGTDALKEYNALIRKITTDQKANAALGQQMGTPDGGHVFANPPGAKGGGGNPYSQALSQQTQAYQAAVKSADNYAKADDAIVQTQKTLIGLYGVTPGALSKINSALTDKVNLYNKISSAGDSYIKKLQEEINKDAAAAGNASNTSKQRQQAAAAEKKAENDLTVAVSAVAEAHAKADQAAAEHDATMAKYTVQATLAAEGVKNWKTELSILQTKLKDTTGTYAQMELAQQFADKAGYMAKALSNAYDTIAAKYPRATEILQNLKQAMDEAANSQAGFNKTSVDDNNKLATLTDTISKAIETIERSNFDTVGGVLGINKQTITYVDQMLSGMQAIQQEQDRINQDWSNASPMQQRLLGFEQQELDLRKQLLPIEQQILAVRSSPMYQAWESEIDKFGQSFGDKITQKLFGGGGAANGWLSVFHQFFSGIGENLFNNIWKSASGSITDSMFGVQGDDQKLKQVWTQIYQQLSQEISAFTAGTNVLAPALAAQNFANPANNLATAMNRFTGGSGSGVPGIGTAGGTGNFSSYEQEFGITNPTDVGQSYTDIGTIAENSSAFLAAQGTTNDLLQQMTQNSIDQWAQLSGLNITGGGSGGGALGGGGGGLFGGLLSMFGGDGGGGGAAGGAGGLAGMLSSPAGMLMAALSIGSGLGGIMGSNVGKAGTSGREMYGMFGSVLGGGAVAGLGALMGSFMGISGFAALGGPYGILAGALLGGVLGSLFGDHFPISNEPDIGEPVYGGVSYGQFVADMTGEPGSFNGQTMNPLSQYSGPQNAESYQLEQDVQKVLSAPNGQYPPQLVQMAHQLQQFNPGNEPYGFSINGEYNDVFTLHSGAKVPVQQYQTLVQQFMQLFGQQGNKPLAPIISINGAGVAGNYMPNIYNTPGLTSSEFQQFEQSNMASFGGGYSTPGVGNGGSGSAPPPVMGGNWVGRQPTGGSGGNVTVQLLVNGKVLAQIVNAFNAQYLLNSGRSIDQIPVIQ